MTEASPPSAPTPHPFAPIYSMTGFATVQSSVGDSAFTLTFKSVNHRFLDLNLRLPNDCDALEAALRPLIKKRIRRGHVDVTLHVDRRARETTHLLQLNRELLAAHFQLFDEAAKLQNSSAEPDLHEMLRMPGVLTTDVSLPAPDPSRILSLEATVLAIAPSLLDQLNHVRAAEGAALVAELHSSMLRLRSLAAESTTLRMGARAAHFERLRFRLAELLDSGSANQPGTEPTDHRLLAEAALLVERSDVEEELVRLRAHIETFLSMLDAGGELGKRLDFLLQELNREANTMLSKTTAGDPAIGLRLTTLGLAMKTEIERAREQVQNLE